VCGISGYVGKHKHRDAVAVVLEGIQKLEYRGYDSAGIAAIVNGKLQKKKEVGKVAFLKETVGLEQWQAQVAIAHTRWATHGKPTQVNAHPHHDHHHSCLLVHNGIIENYDILRAELLACGIPFVSETDTEVISQLIGLYYQGDLLQAVQKTVKRLEGAFAIAVVHEQHPQEIILAAQQSPLCIGVGEEEMFVASDPQAFMHYTRKVIYLHHDELARVKCDTTEIFNHQLVLKAKQQHVIAHELEEASKGHYAHYMLKEIYEQEHTLQRAMFERMSLVEGTALFPELDLTQRKIDRIVILACGSSYHAGLIAAHMIEEWARIPVQVEISSEFRYRNPIIFENTLVVAISQSGETADTLAALRELKRKQAYILGLCNVQNSTMTHEVDASIFLRAGPEIGVASTKAFTSQLAVLYLLALKLARTRHMSLEQGQSLVTALQAVPQQMQQVFAQHEIIKDIARRYAHYHNFFYLGRRYMFPTALEGALKLKEIAYINANGYAAGEMKHGPIALIHADCPTVACLHDLMTLPKMCSNLLEIKARDGLVIAITPEGLRPEAADDVIEIPRVRDEIAPILTATAMQLLAYEIALLRGCEIDQPRNLAKSVTVE